MAEERIALRTLLEPFQQTHLLRFWDRLGPSEQRDLSEQIRSIDFAGLARVFAQQEIATDYAALAARAVAPPAVRADGTGASWTSDEAVDEGIAALRAGRLGMILVAGGQGTRLGFDHPKSMFPLGPLSQRTLLQIHADRLQAVARRYGVTIPLYVMTSPATHAETEIYLESQQWLGWSRDDLRLFCQGTLPAVDRESGKVLLESPGRIALSPDGHGGLVAALANGGCFEDLQRRGIEHLYYAQIDNPLAPVCDPLLIGHHLKAQSDMTTQVVRKRFALERVGNVVAIDGRVQIIEYSDLPDTAAQRQNPDGSLSLWAGNIAIHVFRTDFLRHAAGHPDELPLHRAVKRVPYVGASGEAIEPSQPNAIKFERFIFDLLPLANHAFVVEGLPRDVFAPVKNADGAPTDTPELARLAMIDQHRRWLVAAGIDVVPGVAVEIHPDWALDAAELASKMKAGTRITKPTYLVPESSRFD